MPLMKKGINIIGALWKPKKKQDIDPGFEENEGNSDDLEKNRKKYLDKLRKQPELLDSLPPITQLLLLRNLMGIPTPQPPSAFLEVEEEEMESEAMEEEEMGGRGNGKTRLTFQQSQKKTKETKKKKQNKKSITLSPALEEDGCYVCATEEDGKPLDNTDALHSVDCRFSNPCYNFRCDVLTPVIRLLFLKNNLLYSKPNGHIMKLNWTEALAAFSPRLISPMNGNRNVLFQSQGLLPRYNFEDIVLHSQLRIRGCRQVIDEAGFVVFYFSGVVSVPTQLYTITTYKVEDLPVVVNDRLKMRDVFPSCLVYQKDKAYNCTASCVSHFINGRRKTLCDWSLVEEAQCRPDNRAACATEVTEVGAQCHESKILTSIALEKAKSVAVHIGKGEVFKACAHKYTHQHGDDDDNSTEYRGYTSHSEYTAKGVHQIDELIELMTEKDNNLETYVCNSANEDTLRRATEIGICSTSISSIAIQLVIWFLVILLLLIIVVIFMMLYRKYKNKKIPQRIITRA